MIGTRRSKEASVLDAGRSFIKCWQEFKEDGDSEVRRLQDHPSGEMEPERDADADDKAFRTPSPEVSSVVRSAQSQLFVFKLIHLCFELYIWWTKVTLDFILSFTKFSLSWNPRLVEALMWMISNSHSCLNQRKRYVFVFFLTHGFSPSALLWLGLGNSLLYGLTCASQGVWQHPWPLPSGHYSTHTSMLPTESLPS